MEDGSLVIHPEFQRQLVWNDLHKEAFIDTILRGLPFPEIYIADGEINLEKRSSTTLVVDGQQRLSTIHKYITDDKTLKLKNLRRFPALSNEEQTQFFDYQVVIRDLGRIDISVIKEIFSRINSVQYALNAMEINNALYEGEYINTAKKISHKCKLGKLEIFSDYQYARMEDIEFILLIMTTIEANGYFAYHKEVENYIKQYDNEYPNKDRIENDIVNVVNLIIEMKLKPDSIWYRKSSLFTLIIELTKFSRKHKNLPNATLLVTLLNNLGDKILENKNKDLSDNRYAQFYYYMYGGTANQKARQTRGQLLEEKLLTLIHTST